MKVKYLLLAVVGVMLVAVSCKKGKDDSVSGIAITGRVTDADGNPIAGLKISTVNKTRSALSRTESGQSIEDSIRNAEKGFTKWEGDNGTIVVPDTIATDSNGEYLILNSGTDFYFTGELPIVVTDKEGAFVSKTGTVTVSDADYKPAGQYKLFADKKLDFKLQPAE